MFILGLEIGFILIRETIETNQRATLNFYMPGITWDVVQSLPFSHPHETWHPVKKIQVFPACRQLPVHLRRGDAGGELRGGYINP